MTTFAPTALTGRRADDRAVALYFDTVEPHHVDAGRPFVRRIGRRYQSGSSVRFSVLFTPNAEVTAASFSAAFGGVNGKLVYREGSWVVASSDAEGDIVPVSESRLLVGVEYSLSLTIDTAAGIWRDVIVDGVKVSPQVVDLVPGPKPADEVFVVDLATGGPEVALPEWVQVELAELGAEELYVIAREQGGRVELTRSPEPEVERVLRPAPLAAVEDGDPVFTFTVDSDGPLAVERAWAAEA